MIRDIMCEDIAFRKREAKADLFIINSGYSKWGYPVSILTNQSDALSQMKRTHNSHRKPNTNKPL